MFKRFVFVGTALAVLAPVLAVTWGVTGQDPLLAGVIGCVAGATLIGATALREDAAAASRQPAAAQAPDAPATETVFALFEEQATASEAHARLISGGIDRDRIDTFGGVGGAEALRRDADFESALPLDTATTEAAAGRRARLIDRLRAGRAVVRAYAESPREHDHIERELRRAAPQLLLSTQRAS